jgi:L-arabinokinase
MDQVTSVMGRDGAMVEILCQAGADQLPAQVLGEVRVPAGYAFIGIHSGVRHEVSGDPYTDTRVAAFMGLRILNAGASSAPRVRHLANLDVVRYLDSLRTRLPERLRGDEFIETYERTDDTVTRVRPDTVYHVRSATDHHVLEASRVPRFVSLLRNPTAEHAMETAGSLMYESHGSYGHNARLGHDLTDHLVGMIQALGTRAGFYGAKITGGGCGGTVAILVRDEPGVHERVESLRARYSAETGRQTMLFTGTSPGADQAGTLTTRYEDLT